VAFGGGGRGRGKMLRVYPKMRHQIVCELPHGASDGLPVRCRRASHDAFVGLPMAWPLDHHHLLQPPPLAISRLLQRRSTKSMRGRPKRRLFVTESCCPRPISPLPPTMAAASSFSMTRGSR
jgi:hypothetical protein